MHCKTLLTGLLLSLALAACSQSGDEGAARVIADNPLPPLNGGDGTAFDPPGGTTTTSDPTAAQTPQGPGGPSGGGGGGTPGGGPVPEPGTILLVGSGLAGIALYRRRQRRRAPAEA